MLVPSITSDLNELFDEVVDNPGKAKVRIAGVRSLKPVSSAKVKFTFNVAP